MRLHESKVRSRNLLAAALVCCALIGWAAPLRAAHEGEDVVGTDHHGRVIHNWEFHHCGDHHDHGDHWYHSDTYHHSHHTHDYWCPGTHFPGHDDVPPQPPPA